MGLTGAEVTADGGEVEGGYGEDETFQCAVLRAARVNTTNVSHGDSIQEG